MVQGVSPRPASLDFLPDPRICQFDRISRRVAEIDRSPTLRPDEIGLDRDPSPLQIDTPFVHILVIHGKAQVTRTLSAMRRNQDRGICSRRMISAARVENQQDLIASVEKDMAPRLSGNFAQAHDIGPESGTFLQILRIDRDLKQGKLGRRKWWGMFMSHGRSTARRLGCSHFDKAHHPRTGQAAHCANANPDPAMQLRHRRNASEVSVAWPVVTLDQTSMRRRDARRTDHKHMRPPDAIVWRHAHVTGQGYLWPTPIEQNLSAPRERLFSPQRRQVPADNRSRAYAL